MIFSYLAILKMFVLMYYRIQIGATLDRLQQGHFSPNVSRGGYLEEKWLRNIIKVSNIQVSVQ